MRNAIQLSIIMTAALLTSGCALKPIFAPSAPACQVESAQCEAPKKLGDHATFSSAVTVLKQEQQSLLHCQQKLHAIQQQVSQCNEQTAEYNQNLQEIQAENRARKPWWLFWVDDVDQTEENEIEPKQEDE